MLTIGDKLPEFNLNACVSIEDGKQFQNITNTTNKGKWQVLFFWPLDFTFVCPTELHAFQEKLAEFESRGCAVVGCSTDTEQSHWGWLQLDKKQGGIKGITYPLVADTTKIISINFDTL